MAGPCEAWSRGFTSAWPRARREVRLCVLLAVLSSVSIAVRCTNAHTQSFGHELCDVLLAAHGLNSPMPSKPVLCPQANYARLDVAKLLCGFPRTVASTAAAPTAATTASAVTTGAASTSAAATPVAPTSAATTPTAAQAPLAASPAAHQSPNPSAHQPNASATPLSPSRGTALASLQSALLDLFPDPPRPNACPDPAAASTSSAPAPPSSPSPAALAAWQERQLEARAKRAAAEVLALRGPLQHKHADPARADTPCEELWSRLCQAVAKQLGGRRPARGLKALLLEEQHVFRTMRLVGGTRETGVVWCWHFSPTHLAVRKVDACSLPCAHQHPVTIPHVPALTSRQDPRPQRRATVLVLLKLPL